VKEKILAALKTKYSSLGFDASALEQMSEFLGQFVNDETGIEPAVNGAETTLKTFQSLIDKRVTDAVTKVKAEPKQEPKTEPKTEPKAKAGEEPPEWAKGLMAKIETLERRETQQAMTAKVRAALNEKKVPESYYKGRSLSIEKDEDVDTLVKQIETDYTVFRQDLVNQGIVISTPQDPDGNKGDVNIAKTIAEHRNNPGASSEGVTAKKLI